MIRHGNRIFNRAFRQATPKLFVKQRAVASITLNPTYARNLTITSTQLPLAPSALLQSSPLSFIETLEGSISSSSSSSSLAVQADEEEDGEEGMVNYTPVQHLVKSALVFTLTLVQTRPAIRSSV